MSKSGVFFVTDELQRVLDNLPADEPRSRLEPFRAFILKWRREGRSYRRIRLILAEQCGVKVATDTLHKFVQRRSRPRRAQPESVSEPTVAIAPYQPVTQRSPGRRSPEEITAMRQAASAANHKPVFQPEEKTKPLFVYDPGRPLTNKPIREEK